MRNKPAISNEDFNVTIFDASIKNCGAETACKHIKSGKQYSNDDITIEFNDQSEDRVVYLDYVNYDYDSKILLDGKDVTYTGIDSDNETHQLTLKLSGDIYDIDQKTIATFKFKNNDITIKDCSNEKGCKYISSGKQYSNDIVTIESAHGDYDPIYFEYTHDDHHFNIKLFTTEELFSSGHPSQNTTDKQLQLDLWSPSFLDP